MLRTSSHFGRSNTLPCRCSPHLRALFWNRRIASLSPPQTQIIRFPPQISSKSVYCAVDGAAHCLQSLSSARFYDMYREGSRKVAATTIHHVHTSKKGILRLVRWYASKSCGLGFRSCRCYLVEACVHLIRARLIRPNYTAAYIIVGHLEPVTVTLRLANL